jgi:carbonic anhydrase
VASFFVSRVDSDADARLDKAGTAQAAGLRGQVAIANARLGAEKLTDTSDVLRDLVAAKKLKIVAAMHDVATGRVAFLE